MTVDRRTAKKINLLVVRTLRTDKSIQLDERWGCKPYTRQHKRSSHRGVGQVARGGGGTGGLGLEFWVEVSPLDDVARENHRNKDLVYRRKTTSS